MKNKKLFKVKSSAMNGTVTMGSSEFLILADNKEQIEKLIEENKKKNEGGILSLWETFEEINKFEIGILKNNKFEKIDITEIINKLK